MEVGHNRWVSGKNLQEPVGNIGRFEGAEADTLEALDRGQLFEKSGQGVSVFGNPVFSPGRCLAVGAEKYPRQDDFPVAGIDQILGFLEDGFYRFLTNQRADLGYNTIGTEGITAILDLEKCPALAGIMG